MITPRSVKLRIGAPDKNRTRDLRFTKPLLYQLSYKGYLLRAEILPRLLDNFLLLLDTRQFWLAAGRF